MIKKREEFNIHLNANERLIINELKSLGVNISKVFKNFIKEYLESIKSIKSISK